MTSPNRSKWNYALWALFAVFLIVLVWRIIDGSGLLPGDTGTQPIAGSDETASGSGQQDLGSWAWTLVVLVGTVLLGGAIAWGEYQTRRISRRDWQAGEARAHDIYKDGR